MSHLVSRRTFLHSTSMGIAALVIGCKSDGSPTLIADAGSDTALPADTAAAMPAPAAGEGTWAWVRIAEDNSIHLAMNKAEMGQGIATGITMLIAEELGASWDQVHVIVEPEIGAFFLPTGGRAGTAESTSIRVQYTALRRVGATAREMLITAAAARLNVDGSSLSVKDGHVHAADGTSLAFGDLVAEAMQLPVPEDVPLKSSDDFSLIGTSPPPKGFDDIVNGKRIYGIDVVVDGMVYAAIRHAPVNGGNLINLDSLTVDGTDATHIVAVPGGLAVVAGSYWTANNVALALPAEFDVPEGADTFSTEGYSQALTEMIESPGVFEACNHGDAETVLNAAATTIEASYEVPFLAHACMEPMTATADVTAEGCELWVPTQGAGGLRKAVAKALELDEESVIVHRTYLGTGFGRKVETDYGVQAALISSTIGKPVKLIWSREEDIKNDFYRPGFKLKVTGSVNAAGEAEAWRATSAGESILAERGLNFPVDPVSVDGLIRLEGFSYEPLIYNIPNQLVSHGQVPSPLRAGFWRSVGLSQNTFFVESFIDELASAAKVDPLDFRLNLLSDTPRAKAVVEQLKKAASWGSPVTPGASQGMGFVYAYESFFAIAVEVTVKDKAIRVHRATGVVDCGVTVHPDLVAAQLEGGIIFGLGAGMMNAITAKNGQVEQSNFYDFPMPLMQDAPEISIVHVSSEEAPGGVGELSIGPTAPAIANAVFAATGQRLRSLPLTLPG
jgi:isoquinoline 1-oxidoreductase subunit beta